MLRKNYNINAIIEREERKKIKETKQNEFLKGGNSGAFIGF